MVAGIFVIGLTSAMAGGSDHPTVWSPPPQAVYLRLDGAQKVCKRVTFTGSRLGEVRYCKPRAVWIEIASRSRQTIEGLQQKASTRNH
ncbi:MAG: hypothetical protein ACXWVO_08010 [Caulobacteraceae bacterium]